MSSLYVSTNMYVLDWEQNVLKPQTLALRSLGSCVIDEL